MNNKIIIGIALVLGGIGTQLASIMDWNETVTPIFVSGLILNISGTLLALSGGKEYQPPRNGKRTRFTDRQPINYNGDY